VGNAFSRLLAPLAIGAAIAAASATQAPATFVIDAAASAVTIHVGRSGVFGFAGHDHEVTAPALKGQILLDAANPSRSRVSVEFDAASLTVTGKGEPKEDVPEVQKVMLSDRVLDVAHYPSIAFASQTVTVTSQSSDRIVLRVEGGLTLHGVTKPVRLPVTVKVGTDDLQAEGKATVRQTDFGIHPVTAGVGTVRVKDEVDVSFSIRARRQ
jgi:polyisoprenoid-binding protein YceI